MNAQFVNCIKKRLSALKETFSNRYGNVKPLLS